ncbi:MAG: DUF2239 family protein [Pseudomonadota bacterium]
MNEIFDTSSTFTVFNGHQRVITGLIKDVVQRLKEVNAEVNAVETHAFLIYSDTTGCVIDIDMRGTQEEIVAKLINQQSSIHTEINEPRGRGRPKLGVIAREVTLLPRHWEWLNKQPGGASVALRKLVEAARHVTSESERERLNKEATYRFISSIAGNFPNFEDVSRALFANDPIQFNRLSADWPLDVRTYANKLACFHQPLSIA